MKFIQILLIILVLLFYYFFRDFIELGGLEFPLLKSVFKLIIILFIMISLKYKDEFMEITRVDKYQKNLEDFFHKKN